MCVIYLVILNDVMYYTSTITAGWLHKSVSFTVERLLRSCFCSFFFLCHYDVDT